MVNIVGNTQDEDFAFYPRVVRGTVVEEGTFVSPVTPELIFEVTPFTRAFTKIEFVSDSRTSEPVEVTYDPPIGDGYYKSEDNEYGTRYWPKKFTVTGRAGTDIKRYGFTAEAFDFPPLSAMVDLPVPAPGSLFRHIYDNIAYMVDGETAGAQSQDRWLPGSTISYNYTTPSLTPNPNLFCSDMDFSCVSVTRNGTNGIFPAVLLNERYVIAATHVNILPGVKLVWQRKDGSYTSAVVTARRDLGGDVAVSELDADVTGIEPAWFFPQDIWNKTTPVPRPEQRQLPNAMNYFSYVRFPVIMHGHNTGGSGAGVGDDWPLLSPPIATNSPHMRVMIGGLGYSSITDNLSFYTISMGSYLTANGAGTGRDWTGSAFATKYQPFSHTVYGGDSSSPVFVPVVQSTGLKSVLLMMYYSASGGAYHGDPVLQGKLMTAMAQMAAARGSTKTYGVQTVDLSAFRDYN